jgi:dihydroxyacetone kinase-like predicted kinase
MSVTFSNATIVRDTDGDVLGYIEKFDDGTESNFNQTFAPDEGTILTVGELRQIADHMENL